ncbi:helix-turn-helix domain-containing protein [Pseudomonas fulva]|uniref:helix-turn-helix domain-containing protein n=1 Tax=Pseudomonas putida group TaxID=136845 RepID=UPI0015F5AF08|nr:MULTISPECIES: helix-turn-helix domain-containing protein [Pseudomonas putida group]MBA5709518.1 hypothetical protein [Pseudomonas fulva]MBF8728532.1 hypothetical protein [Pseudomonas putida]
MARQLITKAHDPLHESRKARLKLASESELPLVMLRDEIDASWWRSLGHGLDCLQGEQVGLGLEQGHDLRMQLERNRLLVGAVTPELDYLVARQGKAGIVILGDAQANVLAIEGQAHKSEARGVTLDPALGALLEGFDWPGNIRQLEIVMRTALAMREDGEQVLNLDYLTGSLKDNELEQIRSALARHQGNVSAAAEALAISRATLYRKLKQLRG